MQNILSQDPVERILRHLYLVKKQDESSIKLCVDKENCRVLFKQCPFHQATFLVCSSSVSRPQFLSIRAEFVTFYRREFCVAHINWSVACRVFPRPLL